MVQVWTSFLPLYFSINYSLNNTALDVSGEKVSILGGHSIGHSEKKMYMYLIPTGFRGRTVSLYSSIIVDKKDYYVLFLGSVVG
jgi:hypothetical protein